MITIKQKPKNYNTLKSIKVPAVTEAILFGGERWFVVEQMLVAYNEYRQPVGLATLNAEGVEGVWVNPHFRRLGVATALLTKACEVKPNPRIECVTSAMFACCTKAEMSGLEMQIIDCAWGGMVLP